ncbi:DNA-binding protein EMBP-1 isoform X3 [Vitis riparia]|uniref:DNA-binding protein EMBP-1 isoform X3 n=1 Tax=Vitis riparia TaxID=96939 RepID=UPI00155A7A0A|nr:DNA-binding protein EMBP-1 isoform X3 [Vitis riparia]
MDEERHSGSNYSSSLSSSRPRSSAAASRFNIKGADRLVKIELEAAEVLADLAQSLMRESESNGAESGGKWGSKGKRGRKRVKSESPPSDEFKNPDNLFPGSSDLTEQQDKQSVVQQECRKIDRNVFLTKTETDDEFAKPSPMCTTTYAPHHSGKLRQNLTEAEKEARRLRRVLANRESARQTIRRRQALCEELSRKAADLSLENETLKREKELAMKEFQSLENKNKHLKAQVAKIIKPEEEKTPESISSHEMTSIPPSTNCPLLLYNQPSFTPFLWSSPERRFQNAFASHAVPDERENPNIDAYRTPLYILPCPWFFPLPNHGNGLHHPPSLNLKDKQDAVNSQCSASSLIKNKSDAHHIPSHSNAMILNPSPLMSLKSAITFKHEGELQSSYIDNGEGGHIVSVFSEKNQEPVICSSKRLVDAVAAAEARKRRKELTKLKNLHGRVRMHC